VKVYRYHDREPCGDVCRCHKEAQQLPGKILHHYDDSIHSIPYQKALLLHLLGIKPYRAHKVLSVMPGAASWPFPVVETGA